MCCVTATDNIEKWRASFSPAQTLVACQQLSQHLSPSWSQVISLWTKFHIIWISTHILWNKKSVSERVISLIWQVAPSDPGFSQLCCQTVQSGELWHLGDTQSRCCYTCYSYCHQISCAALTWWMCPINKYCSCIQSLIYCWGSLQHCNIVSITM